MLVFKYRGVGDLLNDLPELFLALLAFSSEHSHTLSGHFSSILDMDFFSQLCNCLHMKMWTAADEWQRNEKCSSKALMSPLRLATASGSVNLFIFLFLHRRHGLILISPSEIVLGTSPHTMYSHELHCCELLSSLLRGWHCCKRALIQIFLMNMLQ